MTFRWSLGALVMLVCALVSALTADYVRRRSGAVGRGALSLGLAAAAVWSLAYGLELASTTVASKSAWGWVKYTGVVTLPPAWLVFTLQYTGRERRVTPRLLAALAVVPVCLLTLLALPATMPLVRSYPPEPLGTYPLVLLGTVFWLHFAYTMAVASTGTWLLVSTLLRVSAIYRRQAILLVTALALVWATNITTNATGAAVFAGIDTTPVALAVAGLMLTWGVLRLGLLDLVPVARTVLLEIMTDAVLVLDVLHRVVDLNPAAQRAIGCAAGEAIGRRAQDLLGVELPALAQPSGAGQELVLGPGQAPRDYEVVLSALGDGRTGRVGHLLVLRDITARKQVERHLEHLAHHDQLTGLPNRQLLDDRLGDALEAASASGAGVALLCFDIDRFKVVNDSLGHEAGDRVLSTLARRVEQRLQGNGTCARVGGDEFCVLLPQVDGPDQARQMAQEILRVSAEAIWLGEREVAVTVSVGIAVWPHDGRDQRQLVHTADEAMYAAKAAGRNRFVLADGPGRAASTGRLELEADLRRALERDELFLEYQPLLDLRSGGVLGGEALVRWHHPRRGTLQPADFIGVAEEAGLMVAIDTWVLSEACRQLQRWQAGFAPDFQVTVNVCPAHLVGPDLHRTVARVLTETGLDPGRLCIEVSERAVTTEGGPVQTELSALAALGVTLALDDFGAGRTSLAQLRQLPLDLLKVDAGLVGQLVAPGPDAVIVSAVVGLAHALDLRVVAEGVEHRSQLTLLQGFDCDLGQGFLFSPALTAPDFLDRYGQGGRHVRAGSAGR